MEDSDSGSTIVSQTYKETTYEHDRQFQKFSLDNRIYCIPIDEEEEQRLEIQNDILNRLFGQRLFLGDDIEDPRDVLDCGYGQAHWVIAVAEQYEECNVVGIDIYPLELSEEPENLKRYCNNLNQPNLDQIYNVNTFDVIQSRFVAPGIHKNRWPSYVLELARFESNVLHPMLIDEQIASLVVPLADDASLQRMLKPGGTLQMVEYYYNVQSSGGALGSENAIYQWGERYREAMSRLNRDPRIGSSDPRLGGGTKLRQLMEAAGLIEIQQRSEELPIGDWPSDQRQKSIGVRNLKNMDLALDSFAIWPFTEILGMTKEEVAALNARAREELRDPRIKAYIPLTAVWGKRAASSRQT